MHEDWGSKLVNMTDYNHNRPLHIAAKKGNISSLKVMRKREKRERGSMYSVYVRVHMYITLYMYTQCSTVGQVNFMGAFSLILQTKVEPRL